MTFISAVKHSKNSAADRESGEWVVSAMKRYYVGNSGFVQSVTGDWVAYADYLALQAALREALDTWELFTSVYDKVGRQRIAELRKFLDDK